ncbi:hypothetical protein D9M72_261010 [compost metagenome]
MKKEHDAAFRTLSSCGWVFVLFFLSSAATAQSGTSQESTTAPVAAATQAATQTATGEPHGEAADAEEHGSAPLQVGDATQGLLAWQRSGDIASKTPRPIAGSVAQRSYERYLKSFEFPIPERMSSTVKTSSGGGK